MSAVWRPISVPTALARIIFRCIKYYFDDVAATNLSPRQYAWRKGRSCARVTMDLRQHVGQLMQSSETVIVAFSDVSDVFPSLHIPLVPKVSCMVCVNIFATL